VWQPRGPRGSIHPPSLPFLCFSGGGRCVEGDFSGERLDRPPACSVLPLPSSYPAHMEHVPPRSPGPNGPAERLQR
jgi:hypothetical protein